MNNGKMRTGQAEATAEAFPKNEMLGPWHFVIGECHVVGDNLNVGVALKQVAAGGILTDGPGASYRNRTIIYLYRIYILSFLARRLI